MNPNGGIAQRVGVRRLTPTYGLLTVSDAGPGIPLELRERVFERFVRLQGDQQCHGSRLGLTILERAAAQHGATVELLDGPQGRGLTVRVRLPRAEA